jgi:hypothetical protein
VSLELQKTQAAVNLRNLKERESFQENCKTEENFMTRKHILLALCSLMIALPSFAQQAGGKKKAVVDELSGQGYGMAGCGLGSIVFGAKPGMIQIVSATTNGIYSNQTFGITSGTSNCAEEGGAARASLFITANREALEKDISRGSGETLSSLSEIMGCQDSSMLGRTLQENYRSIFPSESISSDQVTDSIMNTVRSSSSLSGSCGNVS